MPTTSSVLADLKRVHPRESFTAGRLDLHLIFLADLDPALLARAAGAVVLTNRYFPQVDEIRAAAAELDLALPSEVDALAQVEARIRWGREREGDPPAVHPLVEESLRLVGGYAALRDAEQPAVIRGQFLRLFREERTRLLREHAAGPASLVVGPRRRELPA